MPQDSNDSEPSPPSSRMQQVTNLANGAAGLAKYACQKAGAATGQVVQWTGPTVVSIAGKSSKVAHGTFDAGKQVYSKINESPLTGQVIQWTGWTFGSIAGASCKAASVTANAGKQAYQNITDNPVTGLVVRFTGATLGSAFTLNLWSTALASRAAREALRATCIRNSISMYRWLDLPASMRAAAVATGVHANNYIISGIVPGLFIAWAVYDGYRLARYAYDQYYEHCTAHTIITVPYGFLSYLG